MSIQTNLHGRLRNTSLPASNGMLPVYEAVSNAIHAIEDATIPLQNGEITIQINRDGQALLPYDQASKRNTPDTKGEIIGFTITDNGIGFNDANMKSFLTLDSEYKAERGGRGVRPLAVAQSVRASHCRERVSGWGERQEEANLHVQ